MDPGLSTNLSHSPRRASLYRLSKNKFISAFRALWSIKSQIACTAGEVTFMTANKLAWCLRFNQLHHVLGVPDSQRELRHTMRREIVDCLERRTGLRTHRLAT